jgi:beta-lactamase superfamily II metal-dependent hydrolase
MITPPSLAVMQREKSIDEARLAQCDPTLRSIKEVTGYQVHASDGEVGHVKDFLIEDDDWSIHYIVVDTGNWWHGNKVLVSPLAVQSIRWTDRLVNLGADRQTVKSSAEYDPSETVDPIYEKKIHKYDGDLRPRESVNA